MPNPTLTARVAPSIVARVERCADTLTARAAKVGDAASDRGSVVRRLILLGLPVLERELGLTAKREATKAAKRAPTKRTARRGAK